MKIRRPKVMLIGAGPGDPRLLTLKALEALQKAEVIFYDNLVNPQILDWASSSSEKIDVGKRGEGSRADQREIESKLVRAARSGKNVVRLKGGDPFIFGRGGEEAERLAKEKISFEVVPGITSPIAAPAYAGIPLTHRDFTSTVVFVTGHPKEVRSKELGVRRHPLPLTPYPSLNWSALAKMGTLVFLMGVKTISEISKNLIIAGKNPQTPVALIRWGTYPKQKTWISTLAEIPSVVKKNKIMPPAVIVVGEVVRLREKIQWFEKRPLFGKRILVTRSRSQAGELSQQLRYLGADVVEIPTIELVPPRSFKDLDHCLRKIQNYSRLIFTSVNAVDYFFSRFKELKKDVRELCAIRIVAVGPTTAQALKELLLKVEDLPGEFHSGGLIKYFSKKRLKGARVLFPRAKKGRGELLQYLKSQRARVDAPVVYENKIPSAAFEKVKRLSENIPFDLLTFTSSSTAENLFRLLRGTLKKCILKVPAVCIGPTTKKTALELGFRVVGMARKATIDDFVGEIRRFFRK